MPPTFLIFLGALVYFPILAAALVAGAVLLCFPRTRVLGRRIMLAAASTLPGLAVAGVVVAILGVVLLAAVHTISAPFATDGKITSSVVAGLIAATTSVTMALMGCVTLALMIASARVGWAMGSGLGMWEVIERDPWLQRIDPWYGTLRGPRRVAAQQRDEAGEDRDG